MNKKTLKNLAVMGIASGLVISQQGSCKEFHAKMENSFKDDSNGNMGYYLMTEEELMLQLNRKGLKLYQSLDEQGKKLARYVASQRCNNTNECKGLNACQTDANDCAGKGNCKNLGKCAFSDKNLAIKIVSEYMAKKRSGTIK